ncbi:hypothetical protein JCM8547_003770 [Rhodosporidiobolus lusitaniae]
MPPPPSNPNDLSHHLERLNLRRDNQEEGERRRASHGGQGAGYEPERFAKEDWAHHLSSHHLPSTLRRGWDRQPHHHRRYLDPILPNHLRDGNWETAIRNRSAEEERKVIRAESRRKPSLQHEQEEKEERSLAHQAWQAGHRAGSLRRAVLYGL